MNAGFLELAGARYSVRKFDPRPVEQEKLENVLQAGRIAPTACNNQPQKVYVIRSEEGLARLRRCTTCHFSAPVVLLVCYDERLSWKRSFDGQDSGFVDASIVTTQMMLQAAELGLGSTWVMYFDPARTREEFALPEHIVPAAMLPMGYPAQDAAPAPMHSSFRPAQETIEYI